MAAVAACDGTAWKAEADVLGTIPDAVTATPPMCAPGRLELPATEVGAVAGGRCRFASLSRSALKSSAVAAGRGRLRCLSVFAPPAAPTDVAAAEAAEPGTKPDAASLPWAPVSFFNQASASFFFGAAGDAEVDERAAPWGNVS